MLTKKQFLERINFIIEYDKAVEKYDKALKEFANSDFTGYYDEKLHLHLLSTLAEDMEQDPEDDLISWWLYDCPEAGKHPEHAKIWDGEKDDPDTTEYDVSTPEKLYDYIFISKAKSPSKETIKMVVKAQDNGVKFALKTIQEIRKTNKKTRGQDWEDRDTILRYTQNKIGDEYLFQRGIGVDLNYSKPFTIISTLEEES